MLTQSERPLLTRPARVFTLSASLTVMGTLAVATVLVGGAYQLVKTLHINAGGGPVHTGTDFNANVWTLSHAVAQPNAKNNITGAGGYQMISGYYNLPDEGGVVPPAAGPARRQPELPLHEFRPA